MFMLENVLNWNTMQQGNFYVSECLRCYFKYFVYDFNISFSIFKAERIYHTQSV